MEKIEIINSFKSMFPNIDEDVITMLYDQYGENLTDILLNLSNDEVINDNKDKVTNDNKDKVTQISSSSTTKDESSENKSKKKENVMSLLGKIYKSNNSNSNNSFDYHKLN